MSTQRSDRAASSRAPRLLGRERPWGLIVAGALVVAVLAAFVVALVLDLRSGGGGPPGGVEDVDVGPAGQHTEAAVDYPQSPPAGGDHNPVWQNAGFYEEPVQNETAVHTLEHGAVWITYQPDLPRNRRTRSGNWWRLRPACSRVPTRAWTRRWWPQPGASRWAWTARTTLTWRASLGPTSRGRRRPSRVQPAPAG